MQVQAAAAGAMALIGLAAGAIELGNNGSPQLLSATSAFSVFMVCSAAGANSSHTKVFTLFGTAVRPFQRDWACLAGES